MISIPFTQESSERLLFGLVHNLELNLQVMKLGLAQDYMDPYLEFLHKAYDDASHTLDSEIEVAKQGDGIIPDERFVQMVLNAWRVIHEQQLLRAKIIGIPDNFGMSLDDMKAEVDMLVPVALAGMLDLTSPFGPIAKPAQA